MKICNNRAVNKLKIFTSALYIYGLTISVTYMVTANEIKTLGQNLKAKLRKKT